MPGTIRNSKTDRLTGNLNEHKVDTKAITKCDEKNKIPGGREEITLRSKGLYST